LAVFKFGLVQFYRFSLNFKKFSRFFLTVATWRDAVKLKRKNWQEPKKASEMSVRAKQPLPALGREDRRAQQHRSPANHTAPTQPPPPLLAGRRWRVVSPPPRAPSGFSVPGGAQESGEEMWAAAVTTAAPLAVPSSSSSSSSAFKVGPRTLFVLPCRGYYIFFPDGTARFLLVLKGAGRVVVAWERALSSSEIGRRSAHWPAPAM
jgi:hypothetical protein